MEEKLQISQLSQLLLFLDRFSNNNTLDLGHVSILEKNFLENAKPSLTNTLKTLDLLINIKDQILTLKTNKGEIADISQLIHQLEKEVNQVGKFNYQKEVAEIVSLGKQFLFKFKEYISQFDEKQGKKIENISTEIIKIDHSKDFSDSFEKTRQYMYFANGSKIYHPNPNNFKETQWNLWYSMSSFKNRGFWDYYYLDFIWPMHEIMHCVKFGVPEDDQVPEFDETEKLLEFFKHGNWHGEFGASFGQLDFLYLVIQKNQNLFLPGFADECILQFAERIYYHHTKDEKVNEELKKGFLKWRDSSARYDPVDFDSILLNHENNNAYEYFLGRLALEHFNFGKNFSPFLDESFLNWEKEFSGKEKNYELELVKKHNVPNDKIPSKNLEEFFEKKFQVNWN